ncbi:helix-turn-helix transcriptional regulator [Dehalococcoides mccartyi]|uniref:Transcriptional regulator, LuxR family n=1 Tax=Dehalococcoides mccartyi (strain ATCC BAA-2266 / KCTC 15142 / 195) TaxID=243164 RepID=Q3Z843_DEHM1|nr:helix-turn-helix transcriptional regulator [Dehalococcoides mccartyi]AAW40611.1 transcriptional regulator, LuxR family [Dehalococcoides mccartyi 195]
MDTSLYKTILKIVIHPSYEWLEPAKGMNISHRELEVFVLMIEGHNNKEIGALLGIQYQSVKNHLHTLNKKLKANNNPQAMVILLSMNVLGLLRKWENTEITQSEYVQNLRETLENPNSGLSKSSKTFTKKFMVEHGLYGELYKDRIEELRNAERPEGQPEKTGE